MAAGLGLFIIAVVGAIGIYVLLALPKFDFYLNWKKRVKASASARAAADNDVRD